MGDLIIHNNGIAIRNDASHVETSVACYELQLLQILMNLIHNATNAVSAWGERWQGRCVSWSVESKVGSPTYKLLHNSRPLPSEFEHEVCQITP